MPDHDITPPDVPDAGKMDIFRSKGDLMDTLKLYRENLKWYVEECNRLVAENESLRAEIGLERMKTHHQRDYPE